MAMVGGSIMIMRIVSSFDGVTVAGSVDAVGDVQTFNAWKIQAERGRVSKVPKMSEGSEDVHLWRVVPGCRLATGRRVVMV